MDLFEKAKTIKLKSYKEKYLLADEDEETVYLCYDGSKQNAIWEVEFVQGRESIRFKSCYGTYLTASNLPFIPKVSGRKVLQTKPVTRYKANTEWEPVRDGMQVRLRTLWGYFLRPNGGLPPWRNSVTHDIDIRNRPWGRSHEKLLWDIEVVESRPVDRNAQSETLFCRSRSFSATSFILLEGKEKTLQEFV